MALNLLISTGNLPGERIMKRIIRIIGLVAVWLMLVSPAAMAVTISAGDYVKLLSYNPANSAGIMTYAVSHDGGNTTAFTYDTFCIQDNVYIWKNEWFLVAGLTNNVGPYDPQKTGEGLLNGAVDYLFYRYKSGAYNTVLTNTSNVSNVAEDDFQRLLWSLQGSGPAYTSTGYAWSNDLAFYTATDSMHHLWGTKVINLIGANGQDIQNQLYNPVPEPSTFLLLGLGLAGAFAFRKRSRK